MIKLILDSMSLTLCFDEQKKLEEIKKSSKFKIKMRRYVKKIEINKILFHDNLTIHDMSKIINFLENQTEIIEISSDIYDHIEQRKYFIESHYRVGNDIKKKEVSIIYNYEWFKKSVDELMDRKLTEDQMWNAYYMYAMKNCSNFSVPGSGKTSTVLGTYAFLKEREEVNKIVMIGPMSAFGSWIDEYRMCFKTSKNEQDYFLNIHDKLLNSVEKKRFELRFGSGNKELILINYESLSSLENVLSEVIDEQTLLVFDEVHKIKNPIGKRATSAKKVCINAGRIITLTGTPIPNSYLDLYNVLNILYSEDYKDFFGFSERELKKADTNQIKLINTKLKPFFCRVTKEQQNVPLPNKDIEKEVHGSTIEDKLFKIIYQTYKNNLFALMARLMQLSSAPQLLLDKLDDSAFKSIVDDESSYSVDVEVKDYSEDIFKLIAEIDDTTKTKETIKLIKKLVSENKKVIVWCVFVSSIELLENKCIDLAIKVKCIYGEVPLDERLQLIRDYQNGVFDVLITNPHTLAESVSLHTVCHDAIYYEYSFNLVHLLQSKDRIHRLGLPEGQYTQYYFMKSNYEYNDKIFSLDDRIYNRLLEKEQIMLSAISNDTLENITSFDEDLKIVFEGFTN